LSRKCESLDVSTACYRDSFTFTLIELHCGVENGTSNGDRREREDVSAERVGVGVAERLVFGRRWVLLSAGHPLSE
jgi:hypothetical protein